MLTEKEAWLKLAACWENAYPRLDSDIYVADVNSGQTAGLCAGIETLYYTNEISYEIYISMIGKIEEEQSLHIGGYGICNAFIWPQNQNGAVMRVGFCRSMADAIS